MSRRHRREQQSWPRAQPRPLRPVDHWRNARTAAIALRPPTSVRAVLDHLVETQALNRHWKLPRIRLGYGKHSTKERAWDERRRAQVAAEVGVRRLVQLPRPQADGFAEKLGCSRRTVIRAMHWLRRHELVWVYHELGTHRVRDRFGVEHEVGRGGCLPGGIGAAATWTPVLAQPEPEAPPPPDPDPDPPTGTRRPLASYLGADPRRSRGP